MTKKQIKILTSVIGFCVLAIVSALSRRQNSPSSPAQVEQPVAQATSTDAISVSSTVQTNAFVIRAVDGDTLIVKLDGEEQDAHIRLLGVNTPESVDPRRPVQCFGKEASHFTATIVGGKRVRLEADPEADERDKYNRLLRNVILEDGTDFNAKLVADGYAYAYVSFPMNKQRKVELRRLQDEAQAAERGLWNPKTCNGLK